MFNLFKKKEDSTHTRDLIWISEAAKFHAILDAWKKDQRLAIICWFPETHQQLNTLFAKETTDEIALYLVKEVNGLQLKGRSIIFAEHYPLHSKEQQLFRQWQLGEAIIYSGMDEPLFNYFGGERIISLMKQLGAEENSVIEHNLISRSVRNAQEKIEKKLLAENSAHSQKQWMERNLPPSGKH